METNKNLLTFVRSKSRYCSIWRCRLVEVIKVASSDQPSLEKQVDSIVDYEGHVQEFDKAVKLMVLTLLVLLKGECNGSSDKLINTLLKIAIKVCTSFNHEKQLKMFQAVQEYVTKSIQPKSWIQDKLVEMGQANPIQLWPGLLFLQAGLTSQKSSARAIIIDQLKKKLQVISKAFPELSHPCWASFYQIISIEEWNGVESEGLGSLFVKAIKKSAESFSQSASEILSALPLSLDLSPLVNDGIMGGIIKMVKSDNLDTRQFGVQAIHSIFERLQNGEVANTALFNIVESLQGKIPGVATTAAFNESQKLSILCGWNHAMIGMSRSNSALVLEPSAQISQSVFTFMQKEKDENILMITAFVFRLYLLHVLNHCLNYSVIHDTLNQARTVLDGALATPINPQRAAMMVIISILPEAHKNLQIDLLRNMVATAISIVKESYKKPSVFGVEGLLSTEILLQLLNSGAANALEEPIKASRIFSTIATNESFVNHENLRRLRQTKNSGKLLRLFNDRRPKLQAIDSAALKHSIVASLTASSSISLAVELFRAKSNDSRGVLPRTADAQWLAELLLSSLFTAASSEFQKNTKESLQILFSEQPELSPILLKHLYILLKQFSKEQNVLKILRAQKVFGADENQNNAPLKEFSVVGKALSQVLIAISFIDQREHRFFSQLREILLTTDYLATAALIVAHPLLAESEEYAKIQWRKFIQAHAKFFEWKSLSSQEIERLAGSVGSALCEKELFISAIDSDKLGARRALQLFFNVEKSDTSERSSPLQIFYAELQQRLAKFLIALMENGLDFFALREDELFVFQDLSTALENSLSGSNAKLAEEDLQVTNADRKKAAPRSTRKGAFGGGAEDDEEWAERIKKEKAQKLASSQAQLDLARDELRSQLLLVKEKVQRSVAEVQDWLQLMLALSGIKSAGVNLGGELLCELLALEKLKFWRFFNSEITIDIFCDALVQLFARVLPGEFRSLSASADLVASLRMVFARRRYFELKREAAEKLDDSVTGNLAGYLLRALHFYGEQNLLDVSSTSLPEPVSRSLRTFNVLHSEVNSGHLRDEVLRTLIYLLAFPLLQEISLLRTELVNVEMSFSQMKSLWATCWEDDSFDATLRSRLRIQSVDRLFALGLYLTVQYPRAQLDVEGFLLEVVMAVAPFSREEWLPLLGVEGLLSEEPACRLLAAQLASAAKMLGGSVRQHEEAEAVLWIAFHDEDTEVKNAVATIWTEKTWDLQTTQQVIAFLSNKSARIRRAAALATAAAFQRHLQNDEAELMDNLLQGLAVQYLDNKPAPAPQETASAPAPAKATSKSTAKSNAPPAAPKARSVAAKQPEDLTIPLRTAIAGVFKGLGTCAVFSSAEGEYFSRVRNALQFIAEHGVTDAASEVRAAMLDAGVTIVSAFGKQDPDELIDMFEDILRRQPAPDEDISSYDYRHSASVVLLGNVARHLEKSSEMLAKILQMQIDSLKIPSESVQRAVSDCLIPLAQTLKGTDRIERVVETLLTTALQGTTYGERRGAAFGLGAIVKGLGIPSLKQYNLIGRLKEATGSSSVSSKQGALFAFECLADRLGLLFEPYIVSIVENLLACFSHSSEHVRDAAAGTTRVIMAKLSAHGVKLILGPILASLTPDAPWKTRVEAIKMLGSMANCAPKQLAGCLPQIVPSLVRASTDSHPKVKDAAKAALAEISAVIRNPEVAQLSPVLLAALADPAGKTKEALDALLQCEFMHLIDAPSLALLVPILARALKDRSADLKRKASAITGNMMTMVSEPKALAPYLTILVPGLKECLTDPIPDVRASGSKALGALFIGNSEQDTGLHDLMPWLMTTLQSEASPVERSGAGQALAEICGSVSDVVSQEKVISKVMALHESTDAAAREGMLWFLSFLPYAMKDRFATYAPKSLQFLLRALSDTSDGVREVALRAGKVIVAVLGRNHAHIVATALLKGIFGDDWRIRANSLSLLGDLLMLVAETKANSTAALLSEEDGEELAGAGGTNNKAINNLRASLGTALTAEVLATIYIARADLVAAVRQTALPIWKAIVVNTPRTLVEIMSTLVAIVVEQLSSAEEDLRDIAGRAIGELVSKLGDKVLREVIRPLQAALTSEAQHTRVGVCLGLREVLSACTKKQATEYLDAFIDAIKHALCDSAEEVSGEAAKAFMTLLKTVGDSAVDQIVPALLDSLRVENVGSAEAVRLPPALQGLRQIVREKPRDMLEYLVPKLVVAPMQVPSIQALASVAGAASEFLHYHFNLLLPALLNELARTQDELSRAELSEESLSLSREKMHQLELASAAIFSQLREEGAADFILDISKLIEDDGLSQVSSAAVLAAQSKRRRWAIWLVGRFFTHCQPDSYLEYLPVLLKHLLSRAADSDTEILAALRECFAALAGHVPSDQVLRHVELVKNCLSSTASAARHKPGSESLYCDGVFLLPLFTLPKSADPFMTIFLHGLTTGSSAVREAAADLMADVCSMTDVDVLKPLVIKAAGPLIRVVGERYPSNVKAAILHALIVLMARGGASLKAFVPQLQTTFVKALADPMRDVRTKAVRALARLLKLSVRIDPLLNELAQLIVATESSAMKLSILEALGAVLTEAAAAKAQPASLEKARAAAQKSMFEEDDQLRQAAGRCVGLAMTYATAAQTTDLLLDLLPAAGGADEIWPVVSGRVLTAGCVLQAAGSKGDETRQDIGEMILQATRDERVTVKISAANAILMLVSAPIYHGAEDRKAEFKTLAQQSIHAFSNALCELAQATASDLKLAVLLAINQGAQFVYGAVAQHFHEFFPHVLALLKDIDLRVKYAAEQTMKTLIFGAKADASTLSAGSAPFQQFLGKSGDSELVKALREQLRKLSAPSGTSTSYSNNLLGTDEESILDIFISK